jgi:hypothetical protein
LLTPTLEEKYARPAVSASFGSGVASDDLRIRVPGTRQADQRLQNRDREESVQAQDELQPETDGHTHFELECI